MHADGAPVCENMKKDLTNRVFGKLTAKDPIRSIPGKGVIWLCECACGGEKEVPASQLLNGHTKSCGCISREKNAGLDITGQRWGRLVAVKQAGYATVPSTSRKQALWLWRCDCSNEKVIPATQVKHQGTRSCGCIFKEHISNLRKEDITGQRFGRMTAICPTQERDKTGNILWELDCACGSKVYKSINELKTGRILSCGCYYQETRAALAQYRKDFVEHTSLSSIVASKQPAANNTSGHTGVYLNRRNGKWEAYINYQKVRYRLGNFS